MHGINRPSNGIRELAAGLEDVLFGPGGYHWFIEQNAWDFANNAVRGQRYRQMASLSSEGLPSSHASPAQLVVKIEESERTPTESRATSRKLTRKRGKSRATPSESTITLTTASPTPMLSATDDGGFDEIDEIETSMGEEEVDEVEFTMGGTNEKGTSSPASGSSNSQEPLSDQPSPTFPPIRPFSHTPSISPTHGGSKGQHPAPNRVYVDMSGLPSILEAARMGSQKSDKVKTNDE